MGADFIAFSSHKMLGPTGVGILWGRMKHLKEMYPFMYGGEMIDEVFVNKTTFKNPPHKFEAGTPAIAEVIAYKEAIKFMNNIGMENIRDHEKKINPTMYKDFKTKICRKDKNIWPDRY